MLHVQLCKLIIKSPVFQVVDNGSGVQNVVDLCEHAPTNKRKVSRNLYGTRRGSLYSIVKLCEKVCVTTRRYNTTTTKVFSSYDKPQVLTEKRNRHSKGTTITIDNVFINMPARSASISYMDVDQTKDTLMKVCIANPTVAITLKDIHSGTKLFQTQSSPNFSDNFLLYCHHGIDWQRLSQVKFDVNGYKLSALLSTALHYKPRQLVYVNRRHIDDERIKRFAHDILTSALGPLDKKNQENRFPVFLFLISCKPINVDMCYDSNTFLEFNDWDSVFTLVYRCIASYLEAEQIPLNVTEEDLSRLATPCPSLRSKLRAASPNFNIKSDKAIRPSKSSALAPPDAMLSEEQDTNITEGPSVTKKADKEAIVDTPRKTNHSKFIPKKRVLNDMNVSPHHDAKTPSCSSKLWTLKTPEKSNSGAHGQVFKTPPFRRNEARLSKLQNAPVLTHLHEANAKLEKASHSWKSERSVEKSFAPSRHSPSTYSLEQTLSVNNHSDRRSSTPLCPSKSATRLLLNISPIEISNKHDKSSAPSVQTKRKRNHRSSSSSVSKKQATKERLFERGESPDQQRFHLQTPRFILDGQNYSSSYKSTSGNNLFGANRDSGYHTVSKQGSSALPLFETFSPQILGTSSRENQQKFDSVVDESMNDDKQPFTVFEDLKEVEAKSRDTFDPSPHRFKVYWDETDTNTKECKENSPVITTNSTQRVLQDKPTTRPELKTELVESKGSEEHQVPLVLVRHAKHRVKVSDCACSPIKIPVDRGCSPVNFTQLNILTSKESVPEQAETIEIVEDVQQGPSECPASQQNLSFDSFSELNDSILAGVDRKIDELTKIPEVLSKDFENPFNEVKRSLNIDTSPIKSPCLECHTQNVTKRLDFASQVRTKSVPSADVANKENFQPQYQVAAPVAAATHLVADCAPWSIEGPKITIINKSAPLDVRKWKTNVFETHGEGAWNIQKNPKVNMNFLLDATKFDKTVFDGMKVIGQIDEKFIGCTTSEGMLIFVDQHAAHERVRLECMLDTIHKEGDCTKGVESKPLNTPIPIKTSKAEAEFVMHISYKLNHIGFVVDASKFHVSLTAIPAFCFTESGNLNISVEDINTAFHQTVHQIRESEGSNLALPVKLVDYLHSKACHGAIRFGDDLTTEQCCVLIRQLSVCDLPFQCAHGRPSFAPIVKLKDGLTGQTSQGVNLDPVCNELSFLKLRSRFQPAS